MPRYFFHLRGSDLVDDEEGQELDGAEAARAEALRAARDLAGEDVRQGRLDLRHWIEVRDSTGEPIASVSFGDAVRVTGEEEGL